MLPGRRKAAGGIICLAPALSPVRGRRVGALQQNLIARLTGPLDRLDMYQRCDGFLSGIFSRHLGKKAAMMTHHGPALFAIAVGLAGVVTLWFLGMIVANGFSLPW